MIFVKKKTMVMQTQRAVFCTEKDAYEHTLGASITTSAGVAGTFRRDTALAKATEGTGWVFSLVSRSLTLCRSTLSGSGYLITSPAPLPPSQIKKHGQRTHRYNVHINNQRR